MNDNINQNFIKIEHGFFGTKDNKETIFKNINPEGFGLYIYLREEQGYRPELNITLKQILDRFEFIKLKKTILKYLMALKNNDLIKCDSITQKTNINQPLIIKVKKKVFDTSFNCISSELFYKYINTIDFKGWSLLCLLSSYHNYEFSSCITDYGYSNPSEDTIAKVLNISTSSVKKYLKILKQNKLIKIVEQQPILNGFDVNGNELWTFVPNHYIVKHKIVGNKYYLTSYDADSVVRKISEKRRKS